MMNSPDHTKLFDIKKEALEAEERIRKHIRETPVEYSPYLSQSGDCKVYLKLENLQLSGSFKLRGVMNKLLSLPEKDRKNFMEQTVSKQRFLPETPQKRIILCMSHPIMISR